MSDTFTDADGTWTRMGGAWALTHPSDEFNARRRKDAEAAALAAAEEAERLAHDQLIEQEMRAIAEERLRAKGLIS